MSPKCYFRYRGKRGWKLTGDKDVCVGCRTRFGSVVVNLHFNPHLLFERKGGPVWCLMGGKCLGVTVVASRNDKRVDSCVHNNVWVFLYLFLFQNRSRCLVLGVHRFVVDFGSKVKTATRVIRWDLKGRLFPCYILYHSLLSLSSHFTAVILWDTPLFLRSPFSLYMYKGESTVFWQKRGCRRCPNNNNKRPDKQLSIVCQTIYLKILWAQSQEQADWTILARFPSLLVFLARGWKW